MSETPRLLPGRRLRSQRGGLSCAQGFSLNPESRGPRPQNSPSIIHDVYQRGERRLGKREGNRVRVGLEGGKRGLGSAVHGALGP